MFGSDNQPDYSAARKQERQRKADIDRKQEAIDARNQRSKDREATKAFSKKKGRRSLINTSESGIINEDIKDGL